MTVQSGTIIPGVPQIDPIIQDNTLARVIEDALYSNQLYRMEASPEKWDAGQGETKIWSRSGLLTIPEDPLAAGADPLPENESFEQWETTAQQWGKATDVNMQVSRATIVSHFLRKSRNLALNAAETLNLLVRNALFFSYCMGHTYADTGGVGVTTFRVGSLAGFTHQMPSTGGRFTSVSASNPKQFYINGVLQVPRVIGATPDSVNNPFGPGVLTVEAAGVTVVADDAITAFDAPFIVRSGGGLGVDALATTDVLTLADIRSGVTQLTTHNVPRHPDGYYHCHIDPVCMNQLFADNEFQRLNEGRFDAGPYQQFAVAQLLGVRFFVNHKSPTYLNGGTQIASRPAGATASRLSRAFYAETINQTGVTIRRTIITGANAVYEAYVPEGDFATEAGYSGAVGTFQAMASGGVQLILDRIRYIIRQPQDRLQQLVGLAWSWTGDFGVPSDILGGVGSARFKRAVVIESGSAA